ncbi:asparagine synthase (glutamine-hydrolyzing) [Pseudoalteromonas sp. APC 3356]|uniref:asparagine synthase (glutamine-hydrolyzing) n=1 Tax=unclassified Pseudoalteromonas TaxID=194690 RepID=UPI00030765BE|nr:MULTISPECIES: asparagine synthase (glutamine-hydrolyzing) [unclassified Pseudoalteromonas]MDN3434313.1 asparagine synthase (glutamine-hydrolyzing) [Pseudoalteromonas sp. APC 3356]
MCGIAGFLSSSSFQEVKAINVLKNMGASIESRGPDSHGEFFDSEYGLGLSHRRLSIHDLSPLGHQPMVTPSGRYVICFNGEIYNFSKIRSELLKKHIAFKGHSDTEVLLLALEYYGVESTLCMIEGMFAFALWDTEKEELFLVRDRTGEKPLYYGVFDNSFVFASQLNAMKCFPAWQGVIDRSSLNLLLRHKYIPAPYSIYSNVHKLEPGTYLKIIKSSNEIVIDKLKYWSYFDVAVNGLKSDTIIDESVAIDNLDLLLTNSIKQQMQSDVPLGALLSGGVDSSTVVGIMQANSTNKINTFSIGFDVPGYNEACFAKEIAEVLGTNHTEMYVTEQDAWNTAPEMWSIYDEPFADSSQIPTFLVSQLAKRHVTVALTGDGGDELFSGYSRYIRAKNLWNKSNKIPGFAKNAISSFGRALPDNPGFCSKSINRFKLASSYLAHDEFSQFYKQIVSDWKQPELLTNANEHLSIFDHFSEGVINSGLTISTIEQAMLLDSMSYLPDDILAKVDRASMGVSLETRVPMLNSKVIEFAWSLPLDVKYRNGEQKWILKKVLDKYVPRKLHERPKMGFGVPLGHWLRGPLKDWASDLLDSKLIEQEGFFDSTIIDRMWFEHCTTTSDHSAKLWSVLMFQSWYRNTNHNFSEESYL